MLARGAGCHEQETAAPPFQRLESAEVAGNIATETGDAFPIFNSAELSNVQQSPYNAYLAARVWGFLQDFRWDEGCTMRFRARKEKHSGQCDKHQQSDGDVHVEGKSATLDVFVSLPLRQAHIH